VPDDIARLAVIPGGAVAFTAAGGTDHSRP
jgi:hypothetical protein